MLEKESELDSLRALVKLADQEKVKLAQDFEDEKRKAEDLQFQLEEGRIFLDDLQVRSCSFFFQQIFLYVM